MSTLAIGLVAAAMTISSFAAQFWKILKTREVSALSTPTWILSTAAFAVWTVYGVIQRDWAIIVPNVVCFLLSGFILTLKVMPRRRREAIADAVAPQ